MLFPPTIKRPLGWAVEITGDRESHIQNWYDRVGKWGLLVGYYLPGVRHLIALGGWDRQTAGAHIRSLCICRSLHLVGHLCLRRILFRQRMDSVFSKVRPNLVASSVVIASLVLLYFLVQHFLGKQKP